MSKRLKGKTVLVTGAGGGIGLATVKLFATHGARIIAADRDSSSLARVHEAIRLLGSGYESNIQFLPGNLDDPEYCNRLPHNAFQINNQLDIVINNAGLIRRGNILETSDEDWAISMKINVESIFRICRSAIGIMKIQGYGSIVNTASCWGIYPGPNHIAYCTSKAAVAAMTKCLGRDHAPDGIRINAVCPNEVNTPMLRSGFEIRGLDPDTAIETLNQTVPIGRIAEPEEVAEAIRFLASDESSYICGSLLEINGAKPVY
jgi:NAD(P)-dependent dehydrogenase (short-subunit alcohol dehydrogenase family)